MKKVLMILLASSFFFACSAKKAVESKAPQSPAQVKAEEVVIDKDAHGCVLSTGSRWSEIKQSCIKATELGQRLNPVDATANNSALVAFILYNDDYSKAELFLPNEDKNTYLLEHNGEGKYIFEKYVMDSINNELSIDDKVAYKGEAQ